MPVHLGQIEIQQNEIRARSRPEASLFLPQEADRFVTIFSNQKAVTPPEVFLKGVTQQEYIGWIIFNDKDFKLTFGHANPLLALPI